MDESYPNHHATLDGRRRGLGKRATTTTDPTASVATMASAATAPCGACKFLRRKCLNGCIFAPHFSSDQGSARFAAVHKVFGASNVSKLLLHIPANRRQDAVVTISYEAQARLADPVYGCVSTILALQQQVQSLQAELAILQTQLVNSRYAAANAFHSSQQHVQQQQQHHMPTMLQPTYSNASSSSNNLININYFTSNFDLSGDVAPSTSFDPIHQLSHPSQDEEEDEEESCNPIAFTNHIFR